MAEKSDCVIVGRRADYILRDKKPLRLFIYAGMDFKMQRCREWEHFGEEITDKALRQKIQSVDKERAKYYEFMTGQNGATKPIMIYALIHPHWASKRPYRASLRF